MDQPADLQEQFSLFVRGGEGIEVSNLGTVLRAVGLNPTQATVELHERNFQGRGTISFEAFLPVYNSVKAKKDDGSEEDFIEGLRVFDKEGNGQISVAELRSVLTGLGEKLSDSEVDTLLRNLNVTGGSVDYTAFVKMVMSV